MSPRRYCLRTNWKSAFSPRGQSLQKAKTTREVKTLPAVISGVDNPQSPANSEVRALEVGAESNQSGVTLTPANPKAIIDRIHWLLGRSCGLPIELIDYIINYDLKYRMGADELESDEEPAAKAN